MKNTFFISTQISVNYSSNTDLIYESVAFAGKEKGRVLHFLIDSLGNIK